MALDTTGNWVAGDDLRIIECLLLPFGTYVLDCTQKCMNQLEDMSPEAVLRVRALLDEYDAAKSADSEQNVGDTEGKVLVKADVLEWEVVGNGMQSGAEKEMIRIRYEIANYLPSAAALEALFQVVAAIPQPVVLVLGGLSGLDCCKKV